MGANMQRQAVPLLRPKAPLVGTGMEFVAAKDSGAVVVAKRGGVVEAVSADRIIVRADPKEPGPTGMGNGSGVDIYNLMKFRRSNQNTCINQKPIVTKGERVVRGQVIADGPATQQGELALGQNVLVAFMPWGGYNFEDAILISERLVKDDRYTSIHIEEFEIEARDTKLGKEEITRDIPNVGEEALKDLDESGIIRIGAEVKPGDILVGKVTPKGETVLTPEERLLRAIFGEKAEDVRDASLIVPPGISGTVVDVKVFSRKGVEKDERAKSIEDEEVGPTPQGLRGRDQIIAAERDSKVRARLEDRVGRPRTSKSRGRGEGRSSQKRHEADRRGAGGAVAPRICWRSPGRLDDEAGAEAARLIEEADDQIHVLETLLEERIGRLEARRRAGAGRPQDGQGLRGHEAQAFGRGQDRRPPRQQGGHRQDPPRRGHALPAGRHPGGGGAEPAGRSVAHERRADPGDPPGLGGPGPGHAGGLAGLRRGGREGHQGDAEARQAARRPARPSCTTDGSGKPFHQEVTVGYIYLMKLAHLVDDKIHARSIGPYSLVTQQPLGGKAQFGGQRFGEMEVWALEAYGAAHTLQEILTVKSDDVIGRTKMYESIVKGENALEPGLPESFNVLVKELQSLALDVELVKE